MYTLFRTARPKTIPCPAARPHIAQIREYPPGPETDDSSEESDDDYCYSIQNVVNNVKTALPEITLKLDNINTSLLVDTGSTVNIIDENTHKQLGQPKLKKGHKFYVTKGKHGSLIGYPTAKALNLVNIIHKVNDPTAKNLKLFEGIGKLKDTTVKLHIDESIPPVAQKHRRTPFHLRDKVEQEIQNLP